MHKGLYRSPLGIAAVAASLLVTSLAQAAKPTAAEALSIAPTQDGINYERPDKAEIARCTVETESAGGISGLVVRGPGGQLLRRFLDTNGDNRVDQWCYFKDGIEVYRDIDTDFEKDKAKVNECRWLGTAGTRWGIDENQDGTIDRWKEISPEEVTSELVAAIRDKDAARFRRLLLTAEEINGLGLSEKQAEELRRKIAAAAGSFAKEAGNQKLITAQTEWIHFGGSRPGVIPAGTDGSTKDITVYDNVTAVVETPAAGDKKHAQIVVGSLVRVGDGWRMIDLPRTLSADPKAASLGFFFLAPVANRPEVDGGVAGNVSEESRKLFDDLNALDRSLAAATSNDELARLNARRADLLEKLIGSADNAEDRANWVRQYAETIGAAVTTGAFPEGVQRLEKLADSIGKSDGGKDLVPIVKLRLLQAIKDRDSQSEDADYTKVHQEWVKGLEDFVSEFSSRPEAAEAMLQLAMGFEIAAKPKDAVTWYGRIVKDFPQSDVAQKAAGARYRIESVGKRLALKGKSLDGRSTMDVGSYAGKVVLIHFWANWCEPCKEDIEKIRSLQAKHGKAFQPIGISLDMATADAAKFASENRLTWPQLFEAGGMDESRLATDLGVLTLPTMLLIDKQGRLVSYDLHGDDLDAEVRKLLITTRPASTK